jgi:hypothetical protein
LASPRGTWKLGRDVGYGFGWRVLAGSITPCWADYFNIHHYIFTDSTGAEYRLDVNNNGVWSSRESIYVWYDSNFNRLYFPDGSFWVMGAVSAGAEEDAGTRYPTLMQDSNGNQVLVRYRTGLGVAWTDSSARLDQIEDVRASGSYTHSFTYNSDPIPHLTAIDATGVVPERYTFAYLGSQTLYSPFSPQTAFGATTLLQTVTMGTSRHHQFEYGTSGAGEMSRVIFPYGGDLRWAYRDFTFLGNRTLREVQCRYLTKASGAATQTYTIYRDDGGDANRTVHSYAHLYDPGGTGSRMWYFMSDLGTWEMALALVYEEREQPSQTVKHRRNYNYVRDPNGNPYVSSVLTTLDPGTAYEKQSKTEQTLDIYGNVTQTTIYDYGNLSTPARTYTNTYLTGSQYSSRYIFNRLVTSTVTNGGETGTLVSNTYDYYSYPYYLVDRHYLREHDTANYGANFTARGNVTYHSQGGVSGFFEYDITGMAVKSVRGASTVTASPAMNNAVPGLITPNGNTNLATTLIWNGNLQPTLETGPNGASAAFGYDTFGRRPSIYTSPYGAQTTSTYTESPPTRTDTTILTPGQPGAVSRWVKTTFDGLGRTIKVERGYNTTTVSISETEYDSCACSPLGKLKRVSRPYAPGGTVYWTTYAYDALGRTVSITLPGNSGMTTYVYEGNTVKITDPAGKWKKYTTDAMGNL